MYYYPRSELGPGEETASWIHRAETASAPEYDLRYFFDAGSGVCLWASNEAARERAVACRETRASSRVFRSLQPIGLEEIQDRVSP